MTLFVAYLRVSTTRQGQSGLGLEAQRASLLQHIAAVGGQLLSEHVEVETGGLRDRPVLKSAIAECRRSGAVLLIAKLDRLARNVAFVSSLMEARTEFVALDAPYANRLMLHILAAFAEHEREQIGARTKAALAAAKARGVKLGVNGARLAVTRKAEATAFARQLRPTLLPLVARGLTLAALAEHLNEQGVFSREGAKWTPTTIRRVLVRLDLHSAWDGVVTPARASPAGVQPFPHPHLPAPALTASACSTQ